MLLHSQCAAVVDTWAVGRVCLCELNSSLDRRFQLATASYLRPGAIHKELQLNMDSGTMKLLVGLFLCLSSLVHGQSTTPPPPAVFVFGDSLVDPGNNNYIPAALAKANFPYNGIDFPGGATGRFCNGRTVVDVLCELIGVPYAPPYLAPATRSGQGILQGVSYASAAGGILDATGANYIERLSMNAQIAYFRNTLAQLTSQIGVPQTTNLLATAITAIVIGSNDFINNYLLSSTTTKNQYDTRSYNILLLNTLNPQLTALYNLGFRKFVVAAVGPLGCIPEQLAGAKTPVCLGNVNSQVQDFNAGLQVLLNQLNAKLPGSQFLYANVYDSVNNLVLNPAASGFTTVNQGCCGSGLYNGQAPCLPIASPCPDRSKFVFWDPFHPTEAANVILANGLFTGGPATISPINIQQLLNTP